MKLNKTIGIKQYPKTLIVLYNNIPSFLLIKFNNKKTKILPNTDIPYIYPKLILYCNTELKANNKNINKGPAMSLSSKNFLSIRFNVITPMILFFIFWGFIPNSSSKGGSISSSSSLGCSFSSLFSFSEFCSYALFVKSIFSERFSSVFFLFDFFFGFNSAFSSLIFCIFSSVLSFVHI